MGVEQLVDALNVAKAQVEDWTIAKKWADDGRTFGDEIALIHSELSEALEAYRDHGFDKWYTEVTSRTPGVKHKDSCHIEVGGAICSCGIPQKPEGVASEMADTLIRILDTCARHDIDLGQEFFDKMVYNWTRTERHGGKKL